MCNDCSAFEMEKEESNCTCTCPSGSILKMNFWGNICKECHHNCASITASKSQTTREMYSQFATVKS